MEFCCLIFSLPFYFLINKTLTSLFTVRGGKKKKIKTACIDLPCLLNPNLVPGKKSSVALYSITSSFQQFYQMQAKSFPTHPQETIPQSNMPHSRMLSYFLHNCILIDLLEQQAISTKPKRIAEVSKQKPPQKTKQLFDWRCVKQTQSLQRRDRRKGIIPS